MLKNARYKAQDSALSYYVSQLENLDPKFNMPLTNITWSRDITLRTGLTFGDEFSSFMRASLGGAGTMNQGAGNIPWISAETTVIPGVSINGEKVMIPLRPAAREVSYTSIELDRSQKAGQNIDSQKIDALNLMYQMNTDQMVYIGDTTVGQTGLVNNPLVTATNAPNGASASPLWSSKTPAEILADINTVLAGAWDTSVYNNAPTTILVPPLKFAQLAATLISTAGNNNVLTYVTNNSISTSANNSPLKILPAKWLAGAGAGGTDRIMAYSNDPNLVRFSMVPIRRETPYYSGIRYTAPYLWAFGGVEMIFPETARYLDGI